MSRLYAAIEDSNNLEYLSFVMGNQDAVYSNSNKLPPKFISMKDSLRDKDEKLKLLYQFDFSGPNILVYCVKYDILTLLRRIDRLLLSTGRSRKPKRNINTIIGYEFKRSIKNLYGDFITQHGYTFDEISFEVDNDKIIGFLKAANCTLIPRGETHKIADCIVHANGKHWNFSSSVKELQNEFRDDFHDRVVNQISR